MYSNTTVISRLLLSFALLRRLANLLSTTRSRPIID